MTTEKQLLNDRVRELLIANPDGMTIPQIVGALDKSDNVVRYAVQRMPDVYIDRWVQAENAGKFAAVWVRADIPEDAPRPDGKSHPSRKERVETYRNKAREQHAKRAAKRLSPPPVSQGLTRWASPPPWAN